jgi:L-lactate dehydrogenase (cytochrome)
MPTSARAPQSRRLRNILCLDDLEDAGRRHLPRPVFGYIVGSSETRRAETCARDAFEDYALIPRALVDVSKRRQDVELMGRLCSAPFGIAPMGLSALSAYRGDIVQACGAEKAGIPMILSNSALIRMEDVLRVAPETWIQVYMTGEIPRIDALIDRISATGCKTLVLTVDVPTLGGREHYIRSGFATPFRPSLRLAWDGMIRPRWLFGTFLRTFLNHGMPHFENSYATRGAPILARNVLRDFTERDNLTWAHLAHIRNRWKGKLVIKGVLSPEDAIMACEHGVDAIIVSNHGGRQLDRAIAPLHALPGIVAAVPDIPVMLDGGIRRGTDVLTALALGAKFVFVGRPFNYAASIAGAEGIAHVVDLLRAEIHRDMAMLGANSLIEMNSGMVVRLRATA